MKLKVILNDEDTRIIKLNVGDKYEFSSFEVEVVEINEKEAFVTLNMKCYNCGNMNYIQHVYLYYPITIEEAPDGGGYYSYRFELLYN